MHERVATLIEEGRTVAEIAERLEGEGTPAVEVYFAIDGLRDRGRSIPAASATTPVQESGCEAGAKGEVEAFWSAMGEIRRLRSLGSR
ncbi:MAG: hypothetical protein R3B70_09945 [Polyangiaceae bacterium]